MKSGQNSSRFTGPLKKNRILWHRKVHQKLEPPETKPVKEEISAEEHFGQLETVLQQGRQEYINLFKGCPEALVYTNIDGMIQYINNRFEELTGFSEEEIKGNSLVYCLKPGERAFFETDNRRAVETVIRGKRIPEIEVLVSRTFNQVDNRVAGMLFSFRDISSYQRERKVKRVLYRISQIAGSDIPLNEIYPLIHEQLGELIIATNFYVALAGFGGEEISFPYYTDEASGGDEIFINRYCSSQSIFHYIIKNNKPVFMDFQRYRKMLSYGYIEPWDVMTNTHLWLGVPMKVHQQVIGVIALQSYDNARLYSEKDIDLLEFVAQQLSAAIYRNALERKVINLKQKTEDAGKNDQVSEENKPVEMDDAHKRKEKIPVSDPAEDHFS